jgi:hypothetical protein
MWGSELHVWSSFAIWALVWTVVLNVPPGSTQIISAYRLNFLHGLLSSVVAFMCMSGLLHEDLTAKASITYFIVDFVNIVLNDHIWKAKSYQTPTARKVEYFHHFLCGGFGIFCQLYYRDVCTLDKNPFINFMLAELSTPFLIAWRYYPHNALGIIFAVLFFGVRIIYHGTVLIPDCMKSCNYTVSLRFGILYTLMNLFFMYMIVRKLLRKMRGGKKKKEEDDE